MALRAETRDRLAFALRLAFRQTSSRARRSVAAFLGIAGGLVLVLVQLGFQSALYDSAVRLHQVLDGDLVIVAPEFQALQGLTWIDRATLERAAGHPQVQSVRPLVMTQLMVRNVENDRFVIILALGIDVDAPAVALDRFGPQAADLRLPGRVLFDAASQPMYGPVVERLARDGEVELVTASPQRARQRAFVVTGLYRLGATIVFPGGMLAGIDTLLDAIGQSRERVNIGILRLAPGADGAAVARDLRLALSPEVDIETKASFVARERRFWSQETPIGFLFDMGAVIGFIISAVFVYQVLYQMIDESIAEYALLKTLGHGRAFFLVVVLATAAMILLASLPPALVVASAVYWICGAATQLPVELTVGRVLVVAGFGMAIAMLSGLIAVRRLGRADPAALL
ncbi:putative ABC transport system permease protein [Stella humosa]|uniref:Putative ABC transport system permease protein n=1 Tax=Stella humosa TaxID=94 RepID=A0A3N1MB88_9PROT|nr:FtsX-like permease family protein [Stella humosa]ROQ00030.1 putative ABC transport system permease protein [Stella humosa]BBK30738.1 ABC transporter [Stella humosa]